MLESRGLKVFKIISVIANRFFGITVFFESLYYLTVFSKFIIYLRETRLNEQTLDIVNVLLYNGTIAF